MLDLKINENNEISKKKAKIKIKFQKMKVTFLDYIHGGVRGRNPPSPETNPIYLSNLALLPPTAAALTLDSVTWRGSSFEQKII